MTQSADNGSATPRGLRILRAVTLAIAAIVAAGTLCMGVVGDRVSHCLSSRLATRLMERHGVVIHADLDEAHPTETISGSAIFVSEAPRVATPYGHGRRIHPDRKRSHVVFSSTQLPSLNNGATFSMLLAPDSVTRHQNIFGAAGSASGLTMDIDDGDFVANIRDGTNHLAVSAPVVLGSEGFVRLVVTVSDAEVAIFQNGSETARKALAKPISLQSRRITLPANIHCRYSGVVDEIAVWNRAISADEVGAVSSSRRAIRFHYEPLLAALCDIAPRVTAFGASAMRVLDRLVPRKRGPAIMSAEHPTLVLRMDKADARHLLRSHEKSLHNGYRTGSAADPRRMSAIFNGRSRQVEVCLDDVYGCVPTPRRQCLLIRGDLPELFGGCGVGRVYPPEAHAAIHPDATDVLPLSARYVRLYEDNAFKGLYVVEAFDAPGSAWMARGEATAKSLYWKGSPKPSDILPAGVAMPEALRTSASLAMSDNLFPWSAAELRMRRRNHATSRRSIGFEDHEAPIASPGDVIGANPASMFIVNDLPLASAAAPSVTWDSSDPDVISTDGIVHRPDGDHHAIVTLTATDASSGARHEYRLRVMARKRTLPTLFISIGGVPSREKRGDFTAFFIPEDSDVPVRMSGLVGAGGGIRHHGNSSYVKGTKRPIALKFDEPVQWPDPDNLSRHVLLHNGYSDPTRLRNKISFDAFRAAFNGHFPSPRFAFCEVFVNGEWMGVWEASRRVRDLVPQGTLLYKVRGTNNSLWLLPDTSMLDCVTGAEPDDPDPYAPIRELFTFTGSATAAEFADGIGDRIYLDNAAAYFLMLSFTDNEDAIRMNQYFARLPGEDRFIIIPWDYDKTFLRGERRLGNTLLARLLSDTDGFDSRMADKWRQLRAGPLSDEAIFKRIDEDLAKLEPYMDEEQRLVKPYRGGGDFISESESLKSMVRRQLDFMDRAYGR